MVAYKRTSLSILSFALWMIGAGCGGPLKPSEVQYGSQDDTGVKAAATVAIQLSADNLFDILDRNLRLKIEIWRINEDDTVGTKEGTDQIFPIGTNTEFSISILTLGRKEIRIFILDEQNQQLGSGTFRQDIVPGAQRRDQPILIHIPRESVTRDVMFAVNLNVQSNNPNAPKTFADVRSIFTGNASNSCAAATCHDVTTKAADIDLSTFPFRSDSYENSQLEIVQVSLDRMNNNSAPMPPRNRGGKLPQAQINLVQAWFDGGLLPAPGPNEGPAAEVRNVRICRLPLGSNPNCTLLTRNGQSLNFNGAVLSLPTQQPINLAVQVLGANNVLIHQRDFNATTLPSQGTVTWDITFTIQPSALSIPIQVIEDL